MKKNKTRLDILLLDKNLVESRTVAQTLIMDGAVYVNGVKTIKPSTFVGEDVEIILKEKLKYVSRGGLKIEKAFTEFGLNIKGGIALDIGASTGGFTDFLLQNGAEKVYCVDVGYGQLDYKLRNSDKVVNLERLNVRNLTEEHVKEKADLVTIDTSFISVTKFLENLIRFIKEDGRVLILIKPQFEAGRKFVHKGGVVKDKQVHRDIIKNIALFAGNIGLYIYELTVSPVKGPAGNTEYLALFGFDKTKRIADIEKKITEFVI
ncbi:MAG: TlyA family RNA methyltransferase [Armatimonadota bacterium]